MSRPRTLKTLGRLSQNSTPQNSQAQRVSQRVLSKIPGAGNSSAI